MSGPIHDRVITSDGAVRAQSLHTVLFDVRPRLVPPGMFRYRAA